MENRELYLLVASKYPPSTIVLFDETFFHIGIRNDVSAVLNDANHPFYLLLP